MQKLELQSRFHNEQRFFNNLRGSFSDRPPAAEGLAKKFLTPRIRSIFSGNTELRFYLAPILKKAETKPVRVLSLGSGDGELEFNLAGVILKSDVRAVTIDAVEVSEDLVASCNAKAVSLGLDKYLLFHNQDVNNLDVDKKYDFVIANQILHHIVELENLCDSLSRVMTKSALLMTRDMIGKNGHQAWPEALEIIEPIWNKMPERYKYNHRDGNSYESFPNKDFSVGCFEGIRSQDVLPNLLANFGYEAFYAFGGVVERFVNLGWGANYDLTVPEDAKFVSDLQQINDEALDQGVITPTQICAYFVADKSATGRYWQNRTPENSVRYY